MEDAQKGRSLDSADEFHGSRKKKGMPLAVFLSFNDRDVHPHCPNGTNPYHKCGRHCLDKIPSGNKLLNGDRSVGSSSEGVMLELKGVNPKCPNASNPYHKCADYCFENMAEKCSDAGKGAAVKSKEPNIVGFAERKVNPECKYASNPYHKCTEYCFQGTPERAKPGRGTKPEKPKERKNITSDVDERRVNPNCRYASNPYHRCAEYCFKNTPEAEVPIKVKKGSPREERSEEYALKASSMESECTEASTSCNDSEDSLKIITKNVRADEPEPVFTKQEEEMEKSALELPDAQPLRIDAVDLFQEWAKYCSLKASEENEAMQGTTHQRI